MEKLVSKNSLSNGTTADLWGINQGPGGADRRTYYVPAFYTQQSADRQNI